MSYYERKEKKLKTGNMKIKRMPDGTQKNVSLKNYTTFRIGGNAKYFLSVNDKKEIISAVLAAKKENLPFFILGGGSNILVSDKGYKGVVIKIENCRLKIANCIISAGAGALLNNLVNVSLKNNLKGLEWAAGIPGTLGGAIFGNAGAFEKSMEDVVESIEVFDIREERIKIFKNKNCRFNYRGSVFKKNKNLIILSAELKLEKDNKKKIRDRIKENLKFRRERQPQYPSAGSVFKNSQRFSAGELIEKCGLRGKRIGGAEISEKHANFIVNLGGAKSEDVKKLINLIKKKVKNNFNVILVEEIQHLIR